MNALLAVIGLAGIGQATPDIDDIVQRGFRDAVISGHFEKVNHSELVKINRDFGTQYRVKGTKVWLKDPAKLRIESKIEETSVLYIYNGSVRFWNIPRANLRKSEDNSKAPGKRQTLMDFGILTRSLFNDPFNAKFVRVDRATNDLVFDITYKQFDKSRHRVWVDPDKRYVTKREWYNQLGRHLATFTYEKPVTENGATIATLVTVRNVEGKVAAVTVYDNVQLNTGLPDSLFQIK